MARLIILRHGNTFDTGDIPTRVGAHTDLSLSVSGRMQADALAAHFRDTVFRAAFSKSSLLIPGTRPSTFSRRLLTFGSGFISMPRCART